MNKDRPYTPNPVALYHRLVVGISSGALFDTREEEALFLEKGIDVFKGRRKSLPDLILGKGTAFEFVRALLGLNPANISPSLVEVIIVSKNHPSICLTVTNSIRHHGLSIIRSHFTGGGDVVPYLLALNASLFLSRDLEDVRKAIAAGIPAARVYDPPASSGFAHNQLRIAFDGDAVLFSDEAERIYQEAKNEGLDRASALAAFHKHEQERIAIPLPEGPLAPFLKALAALQAKLRSECNLATPGIRIGLFTSRSFPSHERALRTLDNWGVELDEAHFLGGEEKKAFIQAFSSQIFFDDQDIHLAPAAPYSASAIVPCSITEHARYQPAVSSATAPIEKPTTSTTVKSRSPGISIEAFDQRCRGVFSSYVPMERRKGALPVMFRAFIFKGKSKSPVEREWIVKEIERYSLDFMTAHDPMFNREGDVLEGRLKKILEKCADVKEVQGELIV